MLKRPNTAPPAAGRDDEIKTGNPNIVVAVRVRPATNKEINSGKHKNILRVLDRNVIVFDADTGSPRKGLVPSHASKPRNKQYAFDRVFDKDSTQAEVFEGTTAMVLDGIMQGYNATVFAYGSTGAGKTFTMMGNKENPGVMVLTMQALFNRLEADGEKTFRIGLQYLEIYNETIYDLLNPSGPLDLREDPVKGPCAAGLSEHFPTSASEVLDLLDYGNRNRSQNATEANSESSRSHAVMQIIVHQKDRTSAIKSDVRIGKLSLIDLAGSERAKMTKNRGERLVEGANINRSLLALGNCINALCEGKPGAHIPFRDSKLTRLLKDSLGGNCRTVMIANLSPSSIYYEDTQNTLKYANRAKDIKTKVSANVINVQRHVTEYTKIIAELSDEVAALKAQLQQASTAAAAAPAPAALAPQQTPARVRTQQQDAAQVAYLQTELELNQQKRLALQANLIDLSEFEHDAAVAAKRIRRKLDRWKELNPNTKTPASVAALRRELSGLEWSAQQTEVQKSTVTQQLAAYERTRTKLMAEIPSRITSPSKVSLVEMVIQLHQCKMENFVLDRRALGQKERMAKQEQNIASLEQDLETMRQELKEQKQILTDAGVDSDDEPDEMPEELDDDEVAEIEGEEQVWASRKPLPEAIAASPALTLTDVSAHVEETPSNPAPVTRLPALDVMDASIDSPVSPSKRRRPVGQFPVSTNSSPKAKMRRFRVQRLPPLANERASNPPPTPGSAKKRALAQRDANAGSAAAAAAPAPISKLAVPQRRSNLLQKLLGPKDVGGVLRSKAPAAEEKENRNVGVVVGEGAGGKLPRGPPVLARGASGSKLPPLNQRKPVAAAAPAMQANGGWR